MDVPKHPVPCYGAYRGFRLLFQKHEQGFHGIGNDFAARGHMPGAAKVNRLIPISGKVGLFVETGCNKRLEHLEIPPGVVCAKSLAGAGAAKDVRHGLLYR